MNLFLVIFPQKRDNTTQSVKHTPNPGEILLLYSPLAPPRGLHVLLPPHALLAHPSLLLASLACTSSRWQPYASRIPLPRPTPLLTPSTSCPYRTSHKSSPRSLTPRIAGTPHAHIYIFIQTRLTLKNFHLRGGWTINTWPVLNRDVPKIGHDLVVDHVYRLT